jgi:y4mF family transcriptional regulator
MIIDDTKSLGVAISQTRKKLKVTQKDLALAAGTGLRFISDLENGKATCHVGPVLKVIRALGMRLQLEVP